MDLPDRLTSERLNFNQSTNNLPTKSNTMYIKRRIHIWVCKILSMYNMYNIINVTDGKEYNRAS